MICIKQLPEYVGSLYHFTLKSWCLRLHPATVRPYPINKKVDNWKIKPSFIVCKCTSISTKRTGRQLNIACGRSRHVGRTESAVMAEMEIRHTSTPKILKQGHNREIPTYILLGFTTPSPHDWPGVQWIDNVVCISDTFSWRIFLDFYYDYEWTSASGSPEKCICIPCFWRF